MDSKANAQLEDLRARLFNAHKTREVAPIHAVHKAASKATDNKEESNG